MGPRFEWTGIEGSITGAAECFTLDSRLPGAFPIVVHHFRCHILLVTDRCTAAGSIVGTAASAHSASPISAVWTWAASTVAGDGLFDYLLLDLGVRLSGLGGLPPSDAKGQDQDGEGQKPSHGTVLYLGANRFDNF